MEHKLLTQAETDLRFDEIVIDVADIDVVTSLTGAISHYSLPKSRKPLPPYYSGLKYDANWWEARRKDTERIKRNRRA